MLQVIFFTDPVDEYLMQYLMDYEDKKFQNVSKEGLKLGKDSKGKELKEAFKDLTKWWKGILASENVDDVKISNCLEFKYGWSSNMERIMQSQTLADASKQTYMRGKRVLEINEYTENGTLVKAHVPLRFARLLTPMRQMRV